MEEKATRRPRASEVETPDPAAENHYQLDLEEHAPADFDEAFKSAVAAVDRSKDSAEVEPSSAEMAEGDEPEDEAAESDGQTGDLRERLMRTLADFDNYRKRTEREKQSLRRMANFEVFKDFLGVLDNFERAMESSGSAEDLKQGLQMIVRQHQEILRRHGVERIEAVGKAFDPTVHEAVAREESAGVDVPTVTREMQKGYLLHDRLLRPAMVFVAMPAREPATEPGDGTDATSEEVGGASD